MKTKPSRPHSFRFDSLQSDECINAMTKAGLRVALITGSDGVKRVYLTSKAVQFVTGRSQAAVRKWSNERLLIPARKIGNENLYLADDVELLLTTGEFPHKPEADKVSWLIPGVLSGCVFPS